MRSGRTINTIAGATEAGIDAIGTTAPMQQKTGRRMSKGEHARLVEWLEAHIEGFSGPAELVPFSVGQSNPTYRLSTPHRDYVLRRKPPGVLLPSAHAVDREYRVMKALATTGFPVPNMFALCEDNSVLGSMFYIMDFAPGRIFKEGALPSSSPDERRAIYIEMAKTLADLHGIDHAQIGLANYGKPGDYYARQISRWERQYRASQSKKIPAMDELIALLPKDIPSVIRTSIVHGDFRLDNIVVDKAEPSVKAVLDWELSTLGDPLADFSNYLMNWVMPANLSPNNSGLAGLDLETLGIPKKEEIVEIYSSRIGINAYEQLDWRLGFCLFRLAAIFQGIDARARAGNASSKDAGDFGRRVGPLAELGLSFAKR